MSIDSFQPRRLFSLALRIVLLLVLLFLNGSDQQSLSLPLRMELDRQLPPLGFPNNVVVEQKRNVVVQSVQVEAQLVDG